MSLVRLRTWIALAPLLVCAAEATAQIAQETVDLAVVNEIRTEGLERSQIEQLARHLTDVIGPRLTGSPGMRKANEWTADMLRSWGLEDVQIEPWGDFGRGWERVSFSGQILSPFPQPLHAQQVAWTRGTNGPVAGGAMVIEASVPEDVERYRGQLADAFLLLQEPEDAGPEFESEDRRLSLEYLLSPPEQPAERAGPDPQQMQQMRQRFMRQRELRSAVAALALEEGAAAILTPANRNYGILRAAGGDRSGMRAENPEPLTQLVVSAEQYAQIHRNVTNGVAVRIEIDVESRFFEDDTRAYNTLGDIPGSDLADEYVMIGAHLDSWHMGTGATDNAAGSVVMMEAMRILQALDLTPRRTIRIALWSGEEQGLLGSRAWVENHPDLHDKISAYLNVDNGTGRIRGIWDQSNEAAIPVFEQILWPFRDLGVVAVRHGDTGGTDHLSFDRAGIPGFNFIQDPIEYGFRTHHTSLDTYDHLVLEDLTQAAVVVAATVYHLAMRDEMMPRKAGPPTTN
jgi:hypothetical protein